MKQNICSHISDLLYNLLSWHQYGFSYQLTRTLASSSLTREIISTKACVVSVFGFEAQRSLIILIARLRTLSPVSFIRSATFSIYYNGRTLSESCQLAQICHKVTWYIYWPLGPHQDVKQYAFQQAQGQLHEQK